MAAFNLRKFTDPDLLKTISPDRLIAFLSPWRDYLGSRGLALPEAGKGSVDCDALAHILMQPDASAPKPMVDALYYVNETASQDGMDTLLDLAKARGVSIDHDPRTTVPDVAIQVWLAAPDLLREHHAEVVAFRQKNFLYYGGKNGALKALPSIDKNLRVQLQEVLDDWFEQHRRSRGCRVFVFPRDRKMWILVRHGLPMRREATHEDDGNSSAEVYRPQKHDVLIYDAATDEMAVHADTKGEVKLYLACFGRLAFGDEEYFPPADKFSLDPLVDDGAKALLCEDVEGIEAVRLVEYRRFWGGAYAETEVRKASDVFAALAGRGHDLGERGRLVGAVFKIKFTGSSKERSVTLRPPSNAKYERDEDSELIDGWLARRGFIHEPEGDDDADAPTEVLERA